MNIEGKLRVLVVDDSALNRRSIGKMLAESPDHKVVGKAANGEEALRLVSITKPDVITLDLEMPKMDGFTFLRILMAKNPMPVLVISSYSQQENVFKALELGALDFVTKPDLLMPGDHSIREELLDKLAMVRGSPSFNFTRRTRPPAKAIHSRARVVPGRPSKVVVIGASTGGPGALMEIISSLPETTQMAILVAQHMPEKFTRTFAERLDRLSKVRVKEAEHDECIVGGQVLICPGMRCLEISNSAGELRTRVVHPALKDRYYPSANRLFESAARHCPLLSVGVILTGMADDGTQGALALRKAGGYVISESEESAVVYGMPRAAFEAGATDVQLPLSRIAGALREIELRQNFQKRSLEWSNERDLER